MSTTTESTAIQQDGIRQQVRARYGEIARQDQRGCGCAPSCFTPGGSNAAGTDGQTPGYSLEDLASVPEGSELGLGCGNPIAIASIQPVRRWWIWEVVLDSTVSWRPAGWENGDGSLAWIRSR